MDFMLLVEEKYEAGYIQTPSLSWLRRQGGLSLYKRPRTTQKNKMNFFLIDKAYGVILTIIGLHHQYQEYPPNVAFQRSQRLTPRKKRT